jgi:hypothetical protein
LMHSLISASIANTDVSADSVRSPAGWSGR